MKRATWRVLAFGALMGSVALPASAQMVIGGSGRPNVEVNWSVLDSLGRPPTLAEMLKGEDAAASRAAANPAKSKAVQFRPYKAAAVPAKPDKKVAAVKAKKPEATPVSAKSAAPALPAVAELVQAAHRVETTATAPVKLEGPEISLPKAVVPAAAPITPVAAPVVAAAPASPAVAPVVPAIAAAVTGAAPVTPAPVPVAVPVPVAAPIPVAAAPAVSSPVIPAPVPEAAAEKVEAPAAVAIPAPPPMALTPLPAPAMVVEAAQTASLPPVRAAAPPPAAPAVSHVFKGDTLTVVFGAESSRLPDNVRGELDKLIKRMQKDEGTALQLMAFAEGDDANASKARRLSLSRALEVRKYLMDQGVRSTRIEVRALGNKLEGGGPADRVDAVMVSR